MALRTALYLSLVLASLLVVSGCEAGDVVGQGSDGLTITENTSARFRGSFVEQGLRLEFDAQLEQSYATVQLDINGKVFTIGHAHDTGALDLDGNGVILSDGDKGLLNSFGFAAMDALGTPAEELPLHVQTMLSHVGYFAAAPPVYRHLPRSVQLPVIPKLATRTLHKNRGTIYGITCVGNGARCEAIFSKGNEGSATTWTPGSNWALQRMAVVVNENWGVNREGVGDYSCMGRCGVGCTGFALFERRTLDCLVHDACSWALYKNGTSDTYCGDEYNNAIDDFAGPGWTGCNGSAGYGCACDYYTHADCYLNKTTAASKTCIQDTGSTIAGDLPDDCR
jgi:hypothetical protein